LSAVKVLPAQLDRVWVHEPRLTVENRHPRTLQQAAIDLIEPGNLAIFVRNQPGPVKA
jgi:hypothetical protein